MQDCAKKDDIKIIRTTVEKMDEKMDKMLVEQTRQKAVLSFHGAYFKVAGLAIMGFIGKIIWQSYSA